MKILSIILLFLLSVVNLVAQKGYIEEFYQDKFVSLPTSYISDVDFDGANIWFACSRKFPPVSVQAKGIAKWNGKTVLNYDRTSSALNTDVVYAIVVTETALFLGTDNGLISLAKNEYLNAGVLFNTSHSQKGLGSKILSLKKDGNYLWIGSDKGVAKMDMNKSSDFTYYSGNLWGKPDAHIYTIEKGDNGDMWLGTNGGFVKLSSNGSATLYDKTNSGLLCDSVYSLYWQSSQQKLYVGGDGVMVNGTQYFGMFVYSNGTVNAIEDAIDCGYKELDKIFGRVFSILENSNGDILASIGLSPSSPIIVKPALISIRGNSISKYFIQTTNAGVPNGYLSTQSVYPLYLKKKPNGQIWLGGTDSKGYILYDMSKMANEDENLSVLLKSEPKTIDINQVSALVQHTGDGFGDLFLQSKYEVPKNTCKSPIYASALWMGGLDNNQKLHLAAMTYRPGGTDYFPGPIDTTTGTTKLWGDSSYLKVWKISRWEIEDLKKHHADGSLANGTYTPPADFLSWPAHGKDNYSKNLAPFVDVDNNGIYEPLKGDYPKIKGEQALYWIYNDVGNTHTESGALPIGAEVHAMAYAYNCDSVQANSPNEAINYTTFYDYRIINRSANTYNNMQLGVWTDVDLGNGTDDYVGCNPQNNFAFVYNGDNDDEGALGYGKNPPMTSIVFLSDSLGHFMSYNNDFSAVGQPTLDIHYYQYMHGIWKDGSPLTYGGNGYNTGSATAYQYPGNPYVNTDWKNNDAGTPGERLFVQSTPQFTMLPGQEKNFSYAIVYTRDESAPNGINTSWAKNMAAVKAVKNWYTNNSFPTCLTKPVGLSIGQEIKNPLQQVKVVPNPFSGNTNLVFNLAFNTEASIEIYNMLGQVVQSIPAQQYGAGEQMVTIDLSSQPNGVYFYVLRTEGGQYSGRMVNAVR